MESRVINVCLRNMGDTTSAGFILSTHGGIQDGMKQSQAVFYERKSESKVPYFIATK